MNNEREEEEKRTSKLLKELRGKKFRKLQLPLDPTMRRLLIFASIIYNEDTYAGLLRRIVLDWWHYRKVYLDLGKEFKELREELQGLREELKSFKEGSR